MEGKQIKKKKFLVILLIVILVFGTIGLYVFRTGNYRATLRAVVIKVDDHGLGIMGINDDTLYHIGFTKEGNIGFRQGQEVLIYFDGMVATSFPAQIHHIGKIKIVKQKSDITIPENVLKYYYSSRKNVTVSIIELTKTGISLTLKDTNELPYEELDTYKIYQKNQNVQSSTIDKNRVIPGSENSTSSYLRPY